MINLMIRTAAAVAFLLLAISPANAATRPEPVAQARVAKLIGSAKYTDATGQSGPLLAGMYLGAGTTITTEIGSGVVLDFGPNGQLLNLKDNSTLTIETLKRRDTGADMVTETTLNLEKGRIIGNVKKLSASSRFEVKTSRGVAGIRGTAFEIYAVGIFRCITGQIVVTISNLSNPQSPPQSFTVAMGHGVNAGGDTVPAISPISPVELQVLVGQVKDLPKLVGGGIVRGDGRPGLPPEVKRMIEHALHGPKDTPPPDSDRRTQIYVDQQAAKAAADARAAAQQNGINNPDTLARVGEVASQAYADQFRANPQHPELAATAGAVAAVSSFLAGGTPTQIAAAAASGAESALIFLIGTPGNPFLPGINNPMVSPVTGAP
jgi:hypothetical protein